MTQQELCQTAINMLDRAYVPYSHFPVGAALECSDGTVFTGCNIENAAYGVTICAERTAIFKAVSEGRRDFVRIAIAGRSEDYCVPCGSCRQVMMEFAPELEVICLNGKGESKTFALRELLPYGFDRTWLGRAAARRHRLAKTHAKEVFAHVKDAGSAPPRRERADRGAASRRTAQAQAAGSRLRAGHVRRAAADRPVRGSDGLSGA